jgi:single-strand DNA-binding protein
MAALNKVMLMGNLTRDPQVKQLPSNTTLVEFGLAVSRRYKTAAGEDREDTCFVDCTAFGKQAELIGQYCQKGKPLFVEGRLKYDSWDDKQGFGRRSKVSVVVENFQFLGGRENGAPASVNPGQEAPAGAPEPSAPRPARRRRNSDQPFGDEAMFQEADIPFLGCRAVPQNRPPIAARRASHF